MVADNVYQEPSISDAGLALDVVQGLVCPWSPGLVPAGLAAWVGLMAASAQPTFSETSRGPGHSGVGRLACEGGIVSARPFTDAKAEAESSFGSPVCVKSFRNSGAPGRAASAELVRARHSTISIGQTRELLISSL